MKTIKVKPWGEGQGDFVVINEEDFDPEAHELYGVETDPIAKMKVDELKAALADKGIEIPEGAKKPDLVELLRKASAEQ